MRYAIAVVLFSLLCVCAKADEIVNLSFQEVTILNGATPPTFTNEGGNPGTFAFSAGNEFLSITYDWPNESSLCVICGEFPFPSVYGLKWNINLGGTVSTECGYVTQTGSNVFTDVNCAGPSLQGPFVSSVTDSGDWGSAEFGYVGNVPITIESGFSQVTVTPEPSTLYLLLFALLPVACYLHYSRSSLAPSARG